MKLGRLNHVGIATPSIADSIAFYRDVMGATKIHAPFDMPEQGVKVCFVDTPAVDGALNGTQIELIEPLPGNGSIAAFLERNPQGGQHHICYEVPDIHAANAMKRQGAERAAINAPMQGTAADLIKKAMIAVHKANLPARLLLQVHDELILEVEESKAQEVADQVKKIMEDIAPHFSVPIIAEAGIGPNWAEAH